jgi:hypothetical protein
MIINFITGMEIVRHKHFEYTPDMDILRYAEERISYTIRRYRSKGSQCRKLYLIINYVVILSSAAVPILINLNINKLYATGISFFVVSLVSVDKILHFRDRWKNYQLSEEAIRREQYLSETNSGHYAGLNKDDKFNLLVTIVENIIKQERENTIYIRSTKIEIKDQEDK